MGEKIMDITRRVDLFKDICVYLDVFPNEVDIQLNNGDWHMIFYMKTFLMTIRLENLIFSDKGFPHGKICLCDRYMAKNTAYMSFHDIITLKEGIIACIKERLKAYEEIRHEIAFFDATLERILK